jgi:hypothetical protein
MCAMPWRRKPASWLEYWRGGSPSRTKADGFKTVLVYCVGPAKPESYHHYSHHQSGLKLESLPEWDWHDISAHLKCTKCGAIGYVDTRLNWSEVIDFNRPDGRLIKR